LLMKRAAPRLAARAEPHGDAAQPIRAPIATIPMAR
jgi:hypothetical protein